LNRKKIRKQFRFYCKLFSDVLRLCFQIFFRPPSASILFAIGEPASIGGTEFQANKWAEYLTKRGQKILVFTIGQIKNKKSHTFLNRLKAHRIRYLDLGNLPLAKSLLLQKYTAYLLKQSGAPTLQIFNPLCAPLISPAKKAGMKIIYYETGLPTRDRWWDPLVANIPWIDQVLAVSNASLKQFRSRFHYQGPGAVFFPLIDPPPETNSKRKCNSELHIVYFGRIYWQKGVHDLLTAFSNLLETFPASQLTFIGEGPDKKKLQKKAYEWNIASQTHFVDFQTRELLFERLEKYDLFCLPSLSEGTPCSILEAMSIGLPIIASDVGGIPEIIENQISGILVPPNNPKSLAEAFSLLAEKPELLQQFSANGLNRYENYSAKLEAQFSNIFLEHRPFL